MASAPSDSGPVTGRVDRAGRLISADPQLAELQIAAGLVSARRSLCRRSPQSLVLRPSLAFGFASGDCAGADHDLELWVRAEPNGEDVDLIIEAGVRARSPGPACAIFSAEAEVDADEIADEMDSRRRIAPDRDFAGPRSALGTDQDAAIRPAADSPFPLVPDQNGDML